MAEKKRQPAAVWSIVRGRMIEILSLDSKKVYLNMTKSKLLTATEDEELRAKYGDDYRKRMPRVLTVILPQKPEEDFKVFCECLTEAGYSKIADELKDAYDSSSERCVTTTSSDVKAAKLTTVEGILKASYLELNAACNPKLDNEHQCRIVLLEELAKQKNPIQGTPPIDRKVTARTRRLQSKKKEFIQIVDEVQRFVNRSDIKPYLEELRIMEIDAWMTDYDFEKCKTETCKNPSILVAGLTSAGKSTFINSLLGYSLLPTSHDACTAVLCELNSSDEKKKTASVLYEGTSVPEMLDLENGGRDEFRECASKRNIRKLEVFWPCEFLKYCTLLDSCGVEENFSNTSFSIELIEKCKSTKVLCGFVFILDATRSPEEAVKGARLIQRCRKLVDPKTALFVLNKFDVLSSTTAESRRNEYKEEVKTLLAKLWYEKLWYEFDEEQLICMNSELAYKASEVGAVTEELKKTCVFLNEMLVRGFYHSLLNGLEKVENLTKWIHMAIEDQCQMSRASEADHLEKTEIVMACEARMKSMRHTIDRNLKQLISEFSAVLQSNDETIAAANVDEELLLDLLPHTDAFKKFHEWIEDNMERAIFEISQDLSIAVDPEVKTAPTNRGVYARAKKRLSELKQSFFGPIFLWILKLFKSSKVVAITENKEILERVVRRVSAERIESFNLLYNTIPNKIKNLRIVSCCQNVALDWSRSDCFLMECKQVKTVISSFKKTITEC